MRRILLGLTLTPKIGWKTIHKLILDEIDECCYELSSEQWKKKFAFLTEEQCRHLSIEMDKEKLKEYEKKLKEMNITYFTVVDTEYPSSLSEIYESPWVVFSRGDLSLLQRPSLAIVGSRKTTHYGRMVTEKLVPDLVQKGWVIVSGLALGIDAVSHDSCLKAQGMTIGVLGSGIDTIYPKQNKHLYQKIMDKGLLLSEYPPGTAPHPSYFPQRNRIIAGLSYGVVVIEATKKSGSLITAHCALEQGREVFAIPGSIFDQQSVGTNLLIQQHGAKLVTHPKDIVEELSHVDLPKIKDENVKTRVNEGIMVDDIEKKLLELLKREKRHMNELSTGSSLPFAELTKELLKLEMKGLIKALPGSYYQRIQL
jgi:DNA processing protein